MEPWQSKLAEGDAPGAWDLFAERYARLILATIRRLVSDHDDVMDVYSTVCQALAANECARLRRYLEKPAPRASVATWMVVVVRNLTVDWLREQEGRRRIKVPSKLSPSQQDIYRAICIEGCSHVEAYETIRARTGATSAFPEFLREVRATLAIAPCPGDTQPRRADRLPLPDNIPVPAIDPAETAELARRLADALASQPDDVRLAVELFVVERIPAAEVARVVGWADAKAVYNKVYRALEALRVKLGRDGIGPGDL